MTDRQIIQNAQNQGQYGNFIDVGAAFHKGYLSATRGGTMPTSNVIGAVKNNYENKLKSYLNNLPDSVDLAATPDEYRSQIQNFLTQKKQEYVILANQIDDHVVGSEMYMNIKDQMNNVGGSFKNLANQMKIYGESKAKIIDDIENQSTSLSMENQANVNLLRGIYNEEYSINIDDYGNVSFMGDDGSIALNDLPGYELKDYTTATALTNAATSVYKSGQILKKGGIMYNDTRNKLRIAIDKGGRNTLMSLLHDGLVGDTKLIEDPYISKNVQDYYDGNLSFEGLRDLVVDNYMDVLVETSRTGYRVKQTKIAQAKGRGGATGGTRLTEAARKALANMQNLAAAVNQSGLKIGQELTTQDLSLLETYMPSGYALQPNKKDPTKIDVFSSNTFKGTLDPSSQQFFNKLFQAANINNAYWPLFYKKLSENQSQPADQTADQSASPAPNVEQSTGQPAMFDDGGEFGGQDSPTIENKIESNGMQEKAEGVKYGFSTSAFKL